MTDSLPLSPQVFSILSGLIEERLGLSYSVAEAELLAERVTPRAVERGFESLLDYYYFLRYDAEADAELARLAEALVVNETYFFREVNALQVLVRETLPGLLARGVTPRVWCAACATGEEPLSLAMLLDEAGLLGRVSILASDISERALRHVRAGTYRRRSLRSLPSWVAGRWLTGDQQGMQIEQRLIDAIEWRRINLIEDAAVEATGDFDVILCRNVLIYFNDRTVERVVGKLWQRLRPDGRLVVGTSESLLRFNLGLTCEEQGGAFFYRKTGQ
jgi:chemotaxis protein methyltransferase CheR